MLLDPSKPLGKFLSKLLDLFLLQIYFLLTSIPVITIGAGISAMFSACRRIEDDTIVPVTRTYFSAFKDCFRRATTAWLVQSVAAALLVIAIGYYYSEKGELRIIPLAVAVLLLVIDVALFMYVFPLIAWFDNGLKQHFRNAMVLSVCHWRRTLLLAGLYAFVFLLAVPVVPVLALIAFSGSTFYATLMLRKVFSVHDPQIAPVQEAIEKPFTKEADNS